MKAEIAGRLAVKERDRRRRGDDLAAVSECGDSCGAVDVDSHVALGGQDRRSRVQTHAHSDRPAGEPLSRREGCGDCALGRGKGDEEGIALRIDLDASSCCESFAE